jgi:hypothetical protein
MQQDVVLHAGEHLANIIEAGIDRASLPQLHVKELVAGKDSLNRGSVGAEAALC